MPDYYPFGWAPSLSPQQNVEKNRPYAKSGPYVTSLPFHQETQFRQWVGQNGIPFDPNDKSPDYDMRGFYQALQAGHPTATSAIDPNDGRLHYPDLWKTPSHETFSNQSQYALPTAPSWNPQDQLIDQQGNVQFDDRQQNGTVPFGSSFFGWR